MTWADEANAIIGSVHRALPADADLKTRRDAIRAAKTHMFECTSWGRKVWQKAQRTYLGKYGYVSPHKPGNTVPLLSPLEKAKLKGEVNMKARA